jgi:hypothetical protein
MKNHYLIIAITLSMGIFASNFGSESSSTASSSLISWTQTSLYNIYQGMINSVTGLINIPSSIMNTVAAWTNQQQIFITTAAVATLLAVYQKEVIKKWLNDMVERLTTPKETRKLLEEVNVEEIPWDENYEQRVKGL